MSIQFQHLDDPRPPDGSYEKLDEVRQRAAKRMRRRRGGIGLVALAGVLMAAVAFGRTDRDAVLEAADAGPGPGVLIELVELAQPGMEGRTIRIRVANGTDVDQHYAPQVTIEREIGPSRWETAFTCSSVTEVDSAAGECLAEEHGLIETVRRNSPAHGYGPVESISAPLPTGRYRLSRVVSQVIDREPGRLEETVYSPPFEVN